jgi:hypothetical protein
LHPAPAFPPNASCVREPPGAGGVTLDHERLDLGGVDLTGLSREDVLAALTDAALEAFDELGPADFAVPLRPVRFTPWAAEFAFDPDEARDREGKWTAGAGGGGGDQVPGRPNKLVHERGGEIAGRHVANMRALLGRLRSGAMSPEDVASDAQVYADRALEASRKNFAGRYNAFRARVAAEYGDAALHSQKWANVREVFTEAQDAAARHIQGMAEPVIATAEYYVRHPREAVVIGADDLGRLHDEHVSLMGTFGRFVDRLQAEFGGFRSAHKPLPGHAGFSADAEFYSPDQPRDDRGRWTAGGGEGAAPRPTQADRAALRQASLAAVRAYVRAGGEPTHVEHEQLAAHLARLTVDQLHAVKVEHGLKASGRVKSDLVARLAERFRLHRAKQEPAGRKALAEAVAGREGWHAPRDVMGGHAALHGPTGARVRADSAGTMFDVLAPGSELHSSHATAEEAVRAAEASGRFGTGGTTAEREHAARQEAIAKSRERAAQAKPAGQSAAGLAPEVVAQHQAPYKGAPLDNSHAQEQLGFPKALETLRSWPSDKLQAERRDLLRSSYGMFGQNAKKLLAVVEQVIRERQALQSARHAPAAAPPAPAGGVPTKPPTTLAQLRQAHPNVDFQVIGKGRTSLIDITFGVTPEERRRWAGSAAASGSPTEVIPRLHRYLESIHGPSSAPFSDAGAPLRPVRFVPLVQPSLVAEFAPGGQDDACR